MAKTFPVDDGNFLIYAAKAYKNQNCIDVLEWEDDLARIKYIKKLLKRYSETGELREQLIINHLRVLYNVFETKSCTNMLIFKTWEYLDILKPFLIYLGYWDDGKIKGVRFEQGDLYGSDIPLDQTIIEKLRNQNAKG